MSTINISGSNRFSKRRQHTFRWSVELPRISDSTGGDYKLEVHSATVENFFPVIVEGDNDRLYYTYNGVDGNLQFSEGNYDIYDLSDSLRAGLQQLNAAFDVTFDDRQYKLSLFVPPAVTFSIRRTAPDDQQATDWTLPNGEDRFLELLGWTFFGINVLNFSGGATGFTWVPQNNVRCTGPQYIDLCTTLPVRGSFSQTVGQFNVISRMYLANTPFGSTSVNETILPEDFSVNLIGLPEFDLFVVDPHGLLINPSNFTQNINISYRISFIPV